ncbi:MAG: alpha/beta hydrolase [Ignavibacterium sp.]
MKFISFILLILFTQLTFGQNGTLKPLDINLENYEYPFPVHFINLNIQDEKLKMAYMDVQPDKPNGKVVILLHGKNFNAAYWEETAKELIKNGYRVILPDQIGFGKSSKPENIQYSFQLLAQNTKMLLDSLNIKKTSVLGHSMGGMIATRFTLMYPEVVEKLILENPIGLEDWKVKVPYNDIDKNYQFELNQSYEKIKNYQLENYYDGKWKPEYDKWAKLLAGWTLNKEYHKIAWNAALTSDMVFTQPVCYEFENIKVPTLLIIGQRDRTAIGKNLVSESTKNTMGNYPLLGKLTAQKIKNSKLIELENVGHLPHIETFDKFINPLLNFLNE